MRFAPLAVAMIAASCGGKKSGGNKGSHAEPQAPEPLPGQPVASQVALPAPPPPFPEGTHSLELVRTVGVRLEPADDAKRIGTVAIDTRVGWTQVQHGHGCDKPWVEIQPRGWVCGDYVKASTKPPYGQEVPQLDRGEIVPGIYGKVTAPSSVTYTLAKPEKKPDKKKKPAKKGPVRSPKDVDEDPVVPGVPKMVRGPADQSGKMIEDAPIVGSLNVRQYDELSVGGKTYWKIAQKDNLYVLASAISKHQPSHFSGDRLGDDTGIAVPIAFAWPRGGMMQAWVTAKSSGAGAVRQITQRTLVPILEVATDPNKSGGGPARSSAEGGAKVDAKPSAYRIADNEWISALDVRVFPVAPPPAGLGKHERWIDIDLDTQILVAFEGDEAVYATMVTSGGKETPTETGVYRMWMKESEADMKGLNGEDPYSVATVPWTQFFSPEKGLALHTAYWHDAFGKQRSHGCVNLAPRDARWLYYWSDPQVPPGWTMAAGVVEAPGSIVRIRSATDPTPELKGYAKKVAEQKP